MSDALRVTIVTRSLMMGGTQRHIVKLCRELTQENVSISICLLIKDEPRDLIHELPPQVKLHIFPYKRHDLRTVFWLAKIVREEKSQLIHSFSWHADFYSVFLKILVPGVIVVASERGDRSTRNFYTSAYRWVDRLFVYRMADGFCANSRFGRQLLVVGGCPPRKIHVIPNGINLAWIEEQPEASLKETFNWNSTSTLCCIVGRLIYYKGLDSFIELVRLCQEDIKFMIIGDGPERENLSLLISNLGLSNRVFLVGQVNPVIPYVKAADICVLPNRDSEHCSNSILEYMACGKPVIAMDVGGNPELVVHEENGFLVDADHLEMLPVYLDRLASNKVLAVQMGQAGRTRIEKMFQMNDVAASFYSLWMRFLSSNGVV